MKKIVLSVTNDLIVDQRMHKICTTLTNNGYNVLLIGRKLKNSLPVNRAYAVKRFRLLFNNGVLFYAEYNIRLFFYLFTHRFDYYYAVDLDTILPHYILSHWRSKPLIYDAHEYFPELPEVITRPKVQKVWQKIEQLTVPKATAVITVSKGIAQTFYKKYGIKAHIIRNLPFSRNCNSINKNKNTSEKIILYQGSVNVHRGLEHLINAMPSIDNAQLWVIGEGDVLKKLKQQVAQKQLENKVLFFGKIPFEQLFSYTCRAYLGVSIEENVGESYRLALPNKLFDYIQAEKPVLISNLPEMSEIVQKYRIGRILPDHQPQTIAEIINEMLTNNKEYGIWKQHLQNAKKELIWENEQKKLLTLFKLL